MPMQKRLRNVYVCLECSLKSHRRVLSTATKISDAAPTTQQSLDVSSFVDPYFKGVAPPAPSPLQHAVAAGCDSHSSKRSQATHQQNQFNAGPSLIERKQSETVTTDVRLHRSQLESIPAFRRFAQKLSKGAQPTASVRDVVQRLGQKKRGAEKELISAISHTYSEQSIQDLNRDLTVLQRLGDSKPIDASTKDLIVRLTRNGLLKSPSESPGRQKLSLTQSIAKELQNEPVLQSPAVHTAPKSDGCKSPTSDTQKPGKGKKLGAGKGKKLGAGKGKKLRAGTATAVVTEEGRTNTAAKSRGLQSRTAATKDRTAKRQPTKHQDAEDKSASSKSPNLFKRVGATLRNPRRLLRKVSSLSEVESKFPHIVKVRDLSIAGLEKTGPAVPQLCHDLPRVLFNPGIYQLQDPRSRVYNFDPYLEKIMPVSEFDFKVLKQYITSSRDETLRSLAHQHGKKYVGSSSSMTSVLGQFHFLLSQWREINMTSMSRGFSDQLNSFTIVQRSPSAIYLRYQDGVYAMDADQEFDSANILMSLGKTMEKMFTQNPADFERYRKTSAVKVSAEERQLPEAYQYTHAGDLLMRAQLDAYDPRLPGTGTFDLKTRAVASIRHNVRQHEQGCGYQIKQRTGDWESYEREYYDMMRSAFLKYSLQVRMGRMDGIFVAFHNIERIFGFQYVSLPEMDMATHGQEDTILGDQEFQLSVKLLNDVLNRVTTRFPARSVRLQFETRDLAVGGTFMSIFAEPIDEARIDALQNSRNKKMDAFERHFMNLENDVEPKKANGDESVFEERLDQKPVDSSLSATSLEAEIVAPSYPTAESPNNRKPSSGLGSDGNSGQTVTGKEPHPGDQSTNSPAVENQSFTAADGTDTGAEPETGLLALMLRIQNRVNGVLVKRPVHLTSSDKWTLEYGLKEVTPLSTARGQYQSSKKRKETAMKDCNEHEAVSYYVRKLREMATSGAKWRKAQDEQDAARQRVVLYQH